MTLIYYYNYYVAFLFFNPTIGDNLSTADREALACETLTYSTSGGLEARVSPAVGRGINKLSSSKVNLETENEQLKVKR